MIQKTARERLLSSTIICGAFALAFGATPAFAQAPAQDAAQSTAPASAQEPQGTPVGGGDQQTTNPNDQLGEAEDPSTVAAVVVTGSRIPRPNLTSISPVQTVGEEEIVLGGRANTNEILNQLPQVTFNPETGFSSTSNPLSGPGGTATVDLRGLGQQRTLVLVDGRRLGIGDPNTGNPNASPDLNQIPSQLIERIEVLTGGASATYGSDAVAGVVNFVMQRDFEGLQIDLQAGINQHNQHNDFMQNLLRTSSAFQNTRIPKGSVWDGESVDLSVIFGANSPDGRGNVTTFFTYHNQNPVTQQERDFSGCQLQVNAAGAPFCQGSSNSNIFYLANGTGPAPQSVFGNQFVTRANTRLTAPPFNFNSNDFAYLLQQNTRYTAGYFAQYAVNDKFEVYSDFNMMNSRSNVTIAPTGLFQASGPAEAGGFLVNCNNPLMSAQQQATFCTPAQIAAGATQNFYIGRRNVEGAGRNSFFEHQNYRAVLGARGELFGPFSYDLYASYYYTNVYTASQNYMSISRIQQALLVENGPNGPRCINQSNGCVPYNIFRDGGVTQAALNFLDVTGTARGETTQRVLEGVITGDLSEYGMRSPFAEDGIGVAFGYQYRRENLGYRPDVALLSGDLSGAGGASVAVDDSLAVHEVYAETNVPLVQNNPLIDELVLEAGFRRSYYSLGFDTDTYKVGLQYAPTDDARFRVSYQSAIRAPSILELYTPSSVTNTSSVSTDPCSGPTPAKTLVECQRTGVTPAQYGFIVDCPSGQCAVLTGGNVNLQPEEAKTFSVGMNFTPTFIPRLFASIDYYKIDLEGTVGTVPLKVALDNCLAGQTFFCSYVVRASNGTLFGTSQQGGGYIVGTNVNVGSTSTSGIDLQATYTTPLENLGLNFGGDLSFNYVGSILRDFRSVPLPGQPEYDCAGLFGPTCSTVSPEYRHTFRVAYAMPNDLTISAAWRHLGEVTFEGDSGDPTLETPGKETFASQIEAYNYLDLSALWRLSDAVSLRAGVNNVLDKDPPLIRNGVAGTGQPNTFQTYDLLGRQIFVGLTLDF